MTRFLVINGPNLNFLGRRDTAIYGAMSLSSLEMRIVERSATLGVEVECFQSNSEGAIIDYIQGNWGTTEGIIINPGGLTHNSYSLRDALVDAQVPVIEVHISNIYSREGWRSRSVVSAVARGQVAGLGWRGYLAALDCLAGIVKEKEEE